MKRDWIASVAAAVLIGGAPAGCANHPRKSQTQAAQLAAAAAAGAFQARRTLSSGIRTMFRPASISPPNTWCVDATRRPSPN